VKKERMEPGELQGLTYESVSIERPIAEQIALRALDSLSGHAEFDRAILSRLRDLAAEGSMFRSAEVLKALKGETPKA
jgi:hypothetical protein